MRKLTGKLGKVFLISFVLIVAAFMYLSYRKETVKSEKDMETKLDA